MRFVNWGHYADWLQMDLMTDERDSKTTAVTEFGSYNRGWNRSSLFWVSICRPLRTVWGAALSHELVLKFTVVLYDLFSGGMKKFGHARF